MNLNIQSFIKFRDQSFSEIVESARKHEITHFEKNAFTAFVVGAAHAAETYLALDQFPFKNIKKVEDFDIVIQAYIFLCLVELREFFRLSKNKKEFQDAMDVSKEKLIEDFCKIFGGEDIKKYTEQTLKFFDETEDEMGDPRDLWYNQTIYFGKLLSNDEINFEKLTEDDLAIKLDLSITTQRIQVENAKMFQKIILGKEI